jgi:hypothetical protein
VGNGRGVTTGLAPDKSTEYGAGRVGGADRGANGSASALSLLGGVEEISTAGVRGRGREGTTGIISTLVEGENFFDPPATASGVCARTWAGVKVSGAAVMTLQEAPTWLFCQP